MTRRLLTVAFIISVLSLTASACASGGDRIVFTSDRDGDLDIYSISPSGEEETNLTRSAADEFSPRLSPNGKFVAYLTGEPGAAVLEVISTDGENRSEVANGDSIISDYHWSPDSRRLAFLSASGEQKRVMAANADGSLSFQITSMSGDEVGDWSRDGQLVVFALTEGDERGIYLRNPDGVNEFRLTERADFMPRWSPTSDHIAFISNRDGNVDLYVAEVTDGVAPVTVRLTDSEAAEYDIAWSPNGKEIVFVSDEEGNPEIYSVSREGKSATRLTFNTVADGQPAWSPTGQRIAFVSYLDGDADIFIMDSNGENQKRLTRNDANDTHPSW